MLVISGAIAGQLPLQHTTYRVDAGGLLPAEVMKVADRMVAAGAGGFTIGTGAGAEEISRVSFGTISPDTQYPIASASKLLTAVTIMTLVDEGLLTLDAPVSRWLPGIKGEAGNLTLRLLLSQTSGLAGSGGELYDLAQDHRMTLLESALDVTRRPLVTPPGTVFAYGGPGFQVAGAVAEAATGKPWAEIFREKLGLPLAMSRTYWTHLRLSSEEELPVNETRNPVLQGGAVSTAEDYMHFLSMLAQGGVFNGKRILSDRSIDELFTNQTLHARMMPTGASVLPDANYSLGSWCETWDKEGRCERNSSIGYFGVYPWVERFSGRFGIIFIYNRQNAFRLWSDMEKIRDAAHPGVSHQHEHVVR